MSFPHHDANWVEVADFLDAHLRAGERVLAPDRFWWRLPCPLERWVTDNLVDARRSTWTVVHKGDMALTPAGFLHQLVVVARPVFANAVFVVFTARDDVPEVAADDAHVQAFAAILAELPAVPTEANHFEADRVFGPARRLERFADMTERQRRAAQDEFFRGGGYQYATERDRRYFEELRSHTRRFNAASRGRVLDVACGARSTPELSDDIELLVRFDFSDVAVRMAHTADRDDAPDDARIVHFTGDAHDMPFVDGTFDAALFVDASEHVRDLDRVLAEISRVLRPGAPLLFSYANQDSLHEKLMNALDYPEFRTNHQHIRELGAAEADELLAANGFAIVDSAGVLLYPYWGIPGVDDAVRDVTDEDPVLVDLLVELGRRVGREYSYVGVIYATKTG